MFYLLRRYEEYFDDAKVFLSLTFGFFAGLLAIFLELSLFPFMDPAFQVQVGPGTAFLMFVLGYALFETALKVVFLGTKRYRGRKDTPYYGAAFGLGMGAMMALGFIAINLNAVDAVAQALNATSNATITSDNTAYQILPFITMAAVPLGAVLAHGGAAVYVGRSVSRGELWKGWLIGAALQMPAVLAYALFWPDIGFGNRAAMGPAVISVGYGVALLWIARSKVLDHVVPKEIADQVRRRRRREARRDEEE